MSVKPTIENVAQLAHVSKATVSRVMNNHPSVLPDTRERVWEVIRSLNYEPNRLARSLSANDGFRAILVVYTHSSNEAVDNPYFSSIVNAIATVAERYEYELILHSGNDENAEIEKALSMTNGKMIRGILLLSSRIDSKFVQAISKTNIPMVIVGQRDPAIKASNIISVDTDNYRDSWEIAEYLVQRGHIRFGCIHAPGHYYVAIDRVRGFRDGLSKYGFELSQNCCLNGGYTLESAYKAALELLCSQKVSAIFATDDLKALGVYKAAQNLQLRIPDDISVVGHNDFEYSALLNPPLTTVRVPIYELGVMSASKLLAMIENQSHECSQMLSTELVVRNSVRSFPKE